MVMVVVGGRHPIWVDTLARGSLFSYYSIIIIVIVIVIVMMIIITNENPKMKGQCVVHCVL
jgi:hypothetical protein